MITKFYSFFIIASLAVLSLLSSIPAYAASDNVPAVEAGTTPSEIAKSEKTSASQTIPADTSSTTDTAVAGDQTVAGTPVPTIVPTATRLPMDIGARWEEIQEFIDDLDWASAHQSLKKLLNYCYQAKDDINHFKALLTMVHLYTQEDDYKSGLDLLFTLPFPANEELKAIVYLYRAYCLHHYYQENSFTLAKVNQNETETNFGSWGSVRVLNHCYEDYMHAWNHRFSLGQQAFDNYAGYFSSLNLVLGAKATVRDYLTYAMAEFFSDLSTWNKQEYDKLQSIKPAIIRNASTKCDASLIPKELAGHPLEQIIVIFEDLSSWHDNCGEMNKAVHARLRCSKAIDRIFRKYKMASQGLQSMQDNFDSNQALPEDLEAIKQNLKKRLSW